jgi:hypothetical protein
MITFYIMRSAVSIVSLAGIVKVLSLPYTKLRSNLERASCTKLGTPYSMYVALSSSYSLKPSLSYCKVK